MDRGPKRKISLSFFFHHFEHPILEFYDLVCRDFPYGSKNSKKSMRGLTVRNLSR